ncbi:MAG: hypothetical protein A2552_06835 [Sulfuricurvum sp. RIFOXYD2_FULL_44_160]|nr:MAG: hypothetical protein A2552_06835 [Sulfuricurvum sp. RIFOXYD2_FULL_44_160]OHD94280.1 MAG: hypothetical protein A2517_10870 [Sulfuricurvum sp. RIFOXYD12_FULL_44_77]
MADLADEMGMDIFGEFKIPFSFIRFDTVDDMGGFEALHCPVKSAFIDFWIKRGVLFKTDRLFLIGKDGEYLFSGGSESKAALGYFFIECHFDKTS